ncbi:MAG: hypothetical protein AB7G44_11790 [Bacteroidia bacterium]
MKRVISGKLGLLFLAVSVSLVLFQCKNSSDKPLNPNGDSELALLMRMMNDSTASVKELVEQGKLPEKFPEAFLKIHTAKPTDPTVKTEEFETFADSYVEGLKQLYQSSPSELQTNYNSLVQRCINCHQSVCPGPIKAIKKLKIEE